MFLDSPHLRFQGLYVSRNTYIRQGVAEWKREKTCHLVTYFRYFRFFPDGTLLYRTSPQTVIKVAKSMLGNPCQHGVRPAAKYDQHVHSGRYVIKVSSCCWRVAAGRVAAHIS
jgi:F-box protein 9